MNCSLLDAQLIIMVFSHNLIIVWRFKSALNVVGETWCFRKGQDWFVQVSPVCRDFEGRSGNSCFLYYWCVLLYAVQKVFWGLYHEDNCMDALNMVGFFKGGWCDKSTLFNSNVGISETLLRPPPYLRSLILTLGAHHYLSAQKSNTNNCQENPHSWAVQQEIPNTKNWEQHHYKRERQQWSSHYAPTLQPCRPNGIQISLTEKITFHPVHP
jgi:hypothetical protein